jgi:hypothetical protein
MNLDARLNEVMPSLTARERAVLVLRSWKGRTPEDPTWRSTMPREQAAEFDRLIVLINACNLHVPLYITMIEQHTEKLLLRFAWWDSLVALGLQAWALAELVPEGKRKKVEKALAGKWPAVELPWTPDEDAGAWLGISDQMLAAIRSTLVSLWQELRALDRLLDEVALEFAGEDPLPPVMRGLVEETRHNLSNLHQVLRQMEPLELPEPDEEALELARTFFERGKS